jgi:hypothetical protein
MKIFVFWFVPPSIDRSFFLVSIVVCSSSEHRCLSHHRHGLQVRSLLNLPWVLGLRLSCDAATQETKPNLFPAHATSHHIVISFATVE